MNFTESAGLKGTPFLAMSRHVYAFCHVMSCILTKLTYTYAHTRTHTHTYICIYTCVCVCMYI